MAEEQAYTILVVDDFASIRKVIGDTLHRYGYNTLEAQNGEDALNQLRQNGNKIDLIISDYNMPTMDGYKLLEHVKGDPALKQHPFILLTSEDNNDKKKKAKEVGLDAWVTKPYKIDSFMALIKYNITKSKKNGAV
uniref:Response regulator n=1 Tax=Roseihalotalea indica TaxID=2867963 RepID=A0AA49GNL1_9BACT|nr:response regulator [Tunicatimonas sp. TK19036]